MSRRPSAEASAAGNATTQTQDFAPADNGPPRPPSPFSPSPQPPPPLSSSSSDDLPQASPHVRYDLRVDTSPDGRPAVAAAAPKQGIGRVGTAMSRTPDGLSPILRRRNTRAATFRTVEDFEDFDVRIGWHPGAEPGVDPNKPDGGHASMPSFQYPCDITVVDFSQKDMVMHHLDNATLPGFLQEPQPLWVRCRWINVNGLSWDVVQALGKHKGLHKLAIEDILNTRNRTKADWYSTHACIILTLQKLVHLTDPEDSDSDSGDDGASCSSDGSAGGGLGRKLKRWWRSRSKPAQSAAKTPSMRSVENGQGQGAGNLASQNTGLSEMSQANTVRTLQRYHASPNDARTDFMEKFSVLSEKHLAVTAEQVSIFITDDNTIISFFELSAADVEVPILTRLGTPDTILRQSCDASMIGQAIMDAIIDLAIPVAACYGDVIGDLELDVLTRPNLTHTKKVYITITEINKMLSFINPIVGLVNSLRDHKTEMHQELAAQHLQNPKKGVIVTPMTHTYLGDVLDHCVLITETLQQLRDQAEGMIDLIFNTISAYQNESLKQLTLMTIIFLPLTFITGYFGQNFQPFEVLQYDVQYFWKIAVPTVAVTVLFVMRDIIYESVTSMLQKRDIVRVRESNRKRRRNAAKTKTS
ncbi:hypothetical protein RB595_001171 [Gaeumannomyces hyphopodioides]